MEKTFYSGQEAAEICKVNRITISRWIKSGKIKAEKIGRTLVIPAVELNDCSKKTSIINKEEIEKAVKKVVAEYGETLKLLGKE